MLVPYSKAQSAIGFRSRPILSLNLNLCGLPKSSLIDGQITHLSIEQPIEIIAHHPTAPVIILSEHECRIFTPEWKEHIQLCEDTLDLHGLIGSIGMLQSILKIQDISFKLLFHSQSFAFSFRFRLQSSLHAFHGFTEVPSG